MVSIRTTWPSTRSFRTSRRRRTAATINIHKLKMNNWFSKLSRVGMLAGILTIMSSTALAHDPGLSAAEVRILADRVVAEVSFSPVDWEKVQQLDSNLLAIASKQGPLELRSFNRKPSDANSVHFVLEFANPSGTELRISAPTLANLPRGHKQFDSVYDQENKLLAERMLSGESRDITIALQGVSANGSSVWRFLVLGIEHILT